MAKYIDKRLLKLSKQGGKYLKIDEGESFTGKFIEWKLEENEKYGGMKPVYYFKNENGEVKQLGTKSAKFMKEMSKVSPMSVVSVTRFGEGAKTSYIAKVIKEGRVAKDVDEDDDEEEDEDEEEEEAPKKKKKVVEEDEDEEEDEEDEDEEPVKKKKKKAPVEDDDEDEDDEDDEEEEELFSK